MLRAIANVRETANAVLGVSLAASRAATEAAGCPPGRGGEGGEARVDMRNAWDHASHMPKMVQIRNVPDQVHRTLKARAAHAGMTLSEYLRRAATDLARQPTVDELVERIRRREPVAPFDSAAAVRSERQARR